MGARGSKTPDGRLIGTYRVRPWQRGRKYILTVPKEVVELLSIKGGEKVQVYASADDGSIVYQLVDDGSQV